jgi:hypothetical protein
MVRATWTLPPRQGHHVLVGGTVAAPYVEGRKSA